LHRLEKSRERLSQLDKEIERMKIEAETEATRRKRTDYSGSQTEAERLKKLAREEIDSMVKSSQRSSGSYTLI
jgi:F0F1-type ATP synthase membrane subunit b/b'